MHFPNMMVVIGAVLLVLIALLAVLVVLYFRRPVTAPSAWAVPNHTGRAPARAGEEVERDTYLIVPDITGYTQYLSFNRFSLGHAQHIVSELLAALIGEGAPQLVPAKIEGDAILFAADAKASGDLGGCGLGSTLVRLLATFYARREALQRSNLCPCNACQHIGDLDLKIVVHRGPVLRYHLGGFHELSGLPVIAVHRLLKSNLHLARYLMITQAAGEACRLPAGFEPRAHVESYDGIGEMASRVYSFDPAALPQTATPAARRSLASRGRDLAHKLAANARMLWRAMRR